MCEGAVARRAHGDLGCELPRPKELDSDNLKAVVVSSLRQPLLQLVWRKVGKVLARRVDRSASDISLPLLPYARASSACRGIAKGAVGDRGSGMAHSLVED